MEKDDHYLEGLDDIDEMETVHGEGQRQRRVEGEAPTAWPVEGATRAPIEEEPTRIDRPAPVMDEEPVEMAPEDEIIAEADPDATRHLLSLAPDVPVSVTAVMGRKSVSVKDLLELRSGSVVDLEKLPGDPIDLLAAGRVIAKGELVTVDGNLGIRILKLLK